MIEFKAYASGSKGNLYTVTDGKTKLLIECGISYKDIQMSLNYRLSEIAGCLVSHEHGDHSKSVKEVLKAGVDVYTSQGTAKALGIEHHRIKHVKARRTFRIGTWNIMPFEANHDANEPLAFLLVNELGEKMLFITDSYYVKYRFDDLNVIAIECNYSMDILNANIETGRVPTVMKKRLLKSHFSLENVKEFFKANDLSKVQEIWLLHLSDNNSDEALFKEEIAKLTGKLVHVP